MEAEDEEKLLGSVALQNASSILLARQRAERELITAKEALSETNVGLQLALDAGRLGTWNWDAATDQLTLGPRAAQMVGLPAETPFTRARVRELLHPEDSERARKALDQALAERTDYGVEYRVNRPTGGQCWIAASGRGSYGEDGTVLGMSGVMQDVSERKRADEFLRASEERYRTLFDLGPVAVYSIDTPGVIQKFNRKAAELWGREPAVGDTDERFCGSFKLFRPDGSFMPHEQCPMAEVVSGKIPDARDAEVLIERPDGSRVTVVVNIRPLKNQRGEITGAINCFYDITERKRAEAAAAQLAAIVESSEDAVIGKDLRGVITSWNSGARKLFGYSASEMVGQSIKRLIPPQRQMEEEYILGQIERGEQVRHYETVRLCKDGSSVEVSLTVSAIKDAAGRIVGASKVARDITEQKRKETNSALLAAVSQDLERLTGVDEMMHTIAAKIGEHLNLSLCAFAEINDSAAEGVVTHEWHREGVPSVIGTYRLAEFVSPDFQTAGRAGEIFVVRDTATDPRTDARGYAALGIGSFVSVPLVREGEWRYLLSIYHSETYDWRKDEIELMREITARLWARLERFRVENALRASEDRFRAVADNMSQLAWTCDQLGIVTWYNQRWLDYTGLTFEEMKGWDWSKVQHADHLERVVARVKRSAETGEPWEDTFPLRGKDGAYRWFLSRALPIRDEAGEIVSWFGTNTDVDDQMRADEALKESDHRKNEFLAMLAHELRNPLAPIRNAVQILQLPNATAQVTQSAVQLMERQVGQMVRLVDDLLDVNRISQGKIELRRERMDLESVVDQAVETVRPHCKGRDQDLTIALPSKPIFINADPIRLAQVVGNLLNNACKFTGKGGRIGLTVAREGGQAVIRVRDDGIGIAADQLLRVFDLFTQVDNSLERSAGGLGIGLTLVKNLVEMHDGTVEVHSAGLGHGTEFVVRLPVVEDLAHPPPESATRQATPTPTHSRRILVVDDNRDSASSLAMLLDLTGNQTHTAHDGIEAVEAAASFRPDLVLLDIGLPKLNGFDACRKIREQPWGKSMTLVAVTGWGQDEDRRRSSEAGFDGHLVKPVDYVALVRLLDSLPAGPKR